MSKNFYLTTTLPYVNADPHIGFAFELVTADIIARYRKLLGDDVFFNTGTDEHGLKIFRKAQEEGKDPREYTDEYAAKYQLLTKKLGLDAEMLHFIRTTDPHHKEAVHELWRRCEKSGDIYKKKYKGLYCVGDEMFLKESDLVDGRCPNHPKMVPEEVEEENYFFRLSNYQDKLLKYFSQEDVIVPEWRRLEALNFVKSGLEDFSISRDKTRLLWGVPVPDDDTQIVYVWFDALTNYISTLGWPEDREGNFKKYWEEGETLQLAGKDQVRFQSIMWQAMLMSAGLPTTKRIVYHGFITSGGQKMSKSLGNVIDPIAIIDGHGVDALRYFLARHIHPFEDSDFTMERFKEAYNADLANGLGNLVSRVMKMASDHIVEPVPREKLVSATYNKALEQFDMNRAVSVVWEFIALADGLIQKEQPFKLISSDREKATKIIEFLVSRLGTIADLLTPVMPTTSERIKDCIHENKMPEKSLFPRKE